jgi:hypothetical protein
MSPAPTNAIETRRIEAETRWRTGINDRCPNAHLTIPLPANRRDRFQIQQPQHGDSA